MLCPEKGWRLPEIHGKTPGRQNSDTRHLLSSPNVPMITLDDSNVPLVTFAVKRVMYFMLPLGM